MQRVYPSNRINMLEKKDAQILRIIQQNARVSNAEIGRQIKLAPSAVFERLKKLEERGVISGYVAILNKREIGFKVTAFISIKTSNYGGGADDLLAEIPQVLEVYDVAGDDSYLVKVCVKDTEDLSRLIREEIRTIPDIVSTKTTIVLQTTKESTQIPLDESESIKLVIKAKKRVTNPA